MPFVKLKYRHYNIIKAPPIMMTASATIRVENYYMINVHYIFRSKYNKTMCFDVSKTII